MLFHLTPACFLISHCTSTDACAVFRRLDAKIDSKSGTVVMGTPALSVQDQLVDKCKSLSARTFTLANAVVGSAKP